MTKQISLSLPQMAALLVLVAPPVGAHHSRSNFDLDTVTEFQGTVTRFDWTNPHTGIYIETVTAEGEAVELVVEGNSVPTMVRRGWTRDTLMPGDQVVVRGNLDKNPARYFLYMNSVTKNGVAVGRIPGQPNAQTASVETGGSRDFTGVWRSMGADGQARLLSSPIPGNLPVTELGASSYARFDPDADPRSECIPESLPAGIGTWPYLWEIRREENDDFLFVYENYSTPRTIHMGIAAPPSGTVRDHDGYSIGRMENGTLDIRTTLFSAQPWGNDPGLDSGEQKRIVERYQLLDGGRQLQASYTLEDPEYLAESVTRTLDWTYLTGGQLAAEWADCDPSAGRRHIASQD